MSNTAESPTATRRMPPRTRSNFATRTATDDADQLHRRYSVIPPTPSPNEETTPLLGVPAHSERTGNPYEPVEENDPRESEHRELNFFQRWFSARHDPSHAPRRSSGDAAKSTDHPVLADDSLTSQMHGHGDSKRYSTDAGKPRPGAFPRPVGGTSKLGTFAGVFVPTSLNVLSILMFLRFGFILGQSGVFGMMGKS